MKITILRALVGVIGIAAVIAVIAVAANSWLSGDEPESLGREMAQVVSTPTNPSSKAEDDKTGQSDDHGHDHGAEDAAHDHDERAKAQKDDHGHDHEETAKAGHDDQGHGHGHGHEEEDFERGPQGGRLLEDGPFALELTVFETGVPPQFRVYPYLNGEAVDPSKVDLEIDLGRLGGKTDHFNFKPEGVYLVGEGVVREPHSFDVKIYAVHDGKYHEWSYPSYEGRTTIAAAAAREAKVETEPVGAAVLTETIDVLGRVDFAPGAEATLRARFPGPVLEVLKSIGDKVTAGETLVRIESNESLVAYDIKSPIDGVVLERLTNPGDLATDAPLMVVGDTKRLQADFHIFGNDISRVRPGQKVIVSALDGPHEAASEIQTVLPMKLAATQTVTARVPLLNPNGAWIPGSAVTGVISVKQNEVPMAVRTKALQRFRDFTVVFAKIGDTYEVRMLELGRRTPEWTEVLGGIDPGQEYVVENSFLIKADIEKSGASHAH